MAAIGADIVGYSSEMEGGDQSNGFDSEQSEYRGIKASESSPLRQRRVRSDRNRQVGRAADQSSEPGSRTTNSRGSVIDSIA
ncbi:MAG TPA: hypothetical protein DCQ98_12840 [Planctomycetaceae bacterium]|nr:hypothetical protein [Planctomycetaceae bacterium]